MHQKNIAYVSIIAVLMGIVGTSDFCTAANGASRPMDEVDKLIRQVKPPERFAGYRPSFSVEKLVHSFSYASGNRETTFFVVKDGPRYVALIPVKGGTIRLLSHNPETAPRKLKLQEYRITLEKSFGTLLRTDAYIP